MRRGYPLTTQFDSAERQERLQRLIVDVTFIQVAGFWSEDPGPKRQRLRVLARGRHTKTSAAFVCIQSGGSGSSWYPAELVEIAHDEPWPS